MVNGYNHYMITNITIKNIKGFGDPAKSFNLELKTNRVNIIYAPNGTGKSSIAAAFKLLNGRALAPSKDDMFHKDEALMPELSIVMDGVTYAADRTSNAISPVLESYVINSGTVVSTTQQNIGGRYTKVNGYLDIENITVIDKIPSVVTPRYRVTEIRPTFGVNGKVLANRGDLFGNKELWKACEAAAYSLDLFPNAAFRQQMLDEVKAEINAVEGTADYIIGNAEDAWFAVLETNATYLDIMGHFNAFTAGMSKIECFDFFYQLLDFWSKNKQEIRKANKRTEYEEQRAQFDANLALLDTTWRNIQSAEVNGKLVVQFPHADEISNGQRDILTFVVELLKFKSMIKAGKKYLLIIDEVFDYLDDANTITAQYFLSHFLDLNRGNMYLCLLTHLNPFSFKNYIFNDRKVNFVYLQQTQPVATEEMKAFIAFREGLDKTDAGQCDLYDKLSHDLFHYNPVVVDYSTQIATYKANANLRERWGKTGVLHQVLIDEVNKYLSGNHNYDPYAVAMALRIRVEKIIYEQLGTQAEKDEYVDQKMTKYKFAYAEGHGVMVPDVLNVVNAIHNEADHLKYDAISHQYLEKAMVYKLQNNVIQGMMKQIFGWNGVVLNTAVID